MNNKQKTAITAPVAIIGYGRFGKLLYKILSPHMKIAVYDKHLSDLDDVDNITLDDLANYEHIFLAVPMNALASVLEDIAGKINDGTTVIDVSSVKVYPYALMQQYLAAKAVIIATHPLFGPDSYGQGASARIMMYCAQQDNANYQLWYNFFNTLGMHVYTTTPEQHDQDMAKSQVMTHFIGRVWQMMELDNTDKELVSTLGYQKLLELSQQVCRDSTELYHDMIVYNPYSKQYLQRWQSCNNRAMAELIDLGLIGGE